MQAILERSKATARVYERAETRDCGSAPDSRYSEDMRHLAASKLVGFLVSPVAFLICLALCDPALAAPIWNVESDARPTAFQPSDADAQLQDIKIVDATGGSFSLSFAGQTTTLVCSASAATVQAQLEALSTVGAGNVTVTAEEAGACDGHAHTEYTVTFGGAFRGEDVPLIVANGSSLTGISQSVTVTPSSNDEYRIEIENLGSASSGQITVVDHLPPGVSTTATPEEEQNYPHSGWNCSEGAGQTVVVCTSTAAVEPVGAALNRSDPAQTGSAVVPIIIPVTVAGGTPAEAAANTVVVSGGGAQSAASSSNVNPIDAGPDAVFDTSFMNFRVVGGNGESLAQAGGHPWAVTTDFEFNQELAPGVTNAALGGNPEAYRNVASEEEAKTIVAELPLGLIGNPQATPRCTQRQFTEGPSGSGAGDNFNDCPPNTRVGVVYVEKPALGGPYQLFNLAPGSGHAAEFGFSYIGVPFVFYGDVVDSDRGYVLRVTGLAPQVGLHALSLTFFGDPAAAFETGEQEGAFLTNPVDCVAGEEARRLELHIDTWTDSGSGDPFNGDFSDSAWRPSTVTLSPVEGCDALTFNPSLSLQPSTAAEGGTAQLDEPSGYNVDLAVPQTDGFAELSTPELKTATVTLPQGLSVSPSVANGLQACSVGQIALESNAPASCPLASQLGTVKVTTPLLAVALEGEVFLGEPECSPCTELDASEGRILRLFLQVHSEKLGITIKLPGTVKVNPATGQLTAEFSENPQLPFSDLEVHFKNGPRAPLANPQICGTFTTVSELEPWSAPETPTTVSQSPFAITGCGSSLPFAPSFGAGTTSPSAGRFSPFSVTFARGDGEQNLSGIVVTTPPGLLGEIAGIARCGEAQANAGSCPVESQIGTTTATAGPGSDPDTITGGRVYLTGPYDGGPFGLSIVVPAVAGPFNLGNVVVRAAIAVNPTTAALTITSNPLPQIVDGVPIRLRGVTVEVNRPDFTFNATNCSQQAISAALAGAHPLGSTEADKASVTSSPYAASGCANLPFDPKLTASTGGHASRVDGASLAVKLESAGAGQANVAKVLLTIPKTLSARDSTLTKACVEAVFDANPAACPEGSVIGKATIRTPLLSRPLSGPAYIVSHGNAAFPDVEFVLQGEGVTLLLDGKTDIKDGITYSRFEATPDAPFTTFETELPTGPHAIFAAYLPTQKGYSLCDTKLAMPTTIVGQNGAVISQNTRIAVTGCKPPKRLTRAQRLVKALRACRSKKHKTTRAACERQARTRYGRKHRARSKKSSRAKERK